MSICEECADERPEDREDIRITVGLSEGRTCDRCGKANPVGTDPDKVCGKGSKGMVVKLNGDTVRQIEQGRSKMSRGRSQLWSYLGPIHIWGDFPASTLEIRRDTKIRHEELEADLIAKEVGVDEDTGMVYIQFLVEDFSEISKRLTYSYDKIKEELEEGHLVTKETINRRAEEALEKARAMNTGGSSGQ